MSGKKNFWLIFSTLVIMTMLIAACGGGRQATEAPATQAPAVTEAPATEAPTEPTGGQPPAGGINAMPGGFLEKALAGEYSGTTVTVDGPFTAPDDEVTADA